MTVSITNFLLCAQGQTNGERDLERKEGRKGEGEEEGKKK